ncbi:2-C-methyl-D-erythritol 2,4-cyclodiphosphate synthase [Actinidia chinensis var. chinensis]|uniref:2-C-methyl-D-erythritol 2,4-cyclodiphosphate synthase n=1 Tax=Actinidia chinensis var. chinensis TaxID=1590841 RepID=A0A2R6Q8H4_ACTCC|nr:2-C-methyl-D-erythritol 2,4-cyclodiphosphate synthase [Actinidia chinensis var. chinensis]
MAMATTPLQFASTIPIQKQFNTAKPHAFSSLSSRTTPPLSLRSMPPRARLPAAAADASVVMVAERQTTAATPSKTLPFRVGHGFDLHRLEPGYPLIIGGISIPHDRGCEAHSDGDVLLHCVVDAILGALGLPDIGQIFPDSDPKWKGAASSVFIKEAVRLMEEAGYELGNLDATLILQRPKLSPHKETIRTNLSKLLGADPSVVNLKAKTHEKVDSLGENRSIAAHTVVLLMKT